MSGLSFLRFSPARARDSHGFTLVELLVVVAILGLLLAGLASFAISTMRATQKVDVRTTDHSNAQLAMVVLGRDVRAAVAPIPSEQPSFLIAKPNEAEFTANIGSITRPAEINLSIDEGNRLVETAIEPTGSVVNDDLEWDEADRSTRYVASFLLNDPDVEPLLRYYRVDRGDPDDPDDPGDPLELTELVPDLVAYPDRGLSTRDRCDIGVVQLTLAVGSDPSGRTERFLLTNEIRLPNSPAPTCPSED